jgi:hypothetical protein
MTPILPPACLPDMFSRDRRGASKTRLESAARANSTRSRVTMTVSDRI